MPCCRSALGKTFATVALREITHTHNQPRDRQAAQCRCGAPWNLWRKGNLLFFRSNGRHRTSFSSVAKKNIIPCILFLHNALYKYYWLELVIMYMPRNSWLETNVRFAINLLLSVQDFGCQKRQCSERQGWEFGWGDIPQPEARGVNAVGCVRKRHTPRCIHKMQAIP